MRDLNSLIKKYVDESVWAVVGASNDNAKYGNRIYLKLREAGYTVYPVNRREQMIEGDKAYSSLTDLPEPPAVVNMVVPPLEAPLVVENARAAGAQAIWFQPGAESASAAQWALDHRSLHSGPTCPEASPGQHRYRPARIALATGHYPRPYHLHPLKHSRALSGGGTAFGQS